MQVVHLDVLERITNLRKKRNWSEYQLAERSGLTQSTISSWYHKNMLPSIPSLQRICNAFGISMSQFFLEDEDKAILLNEQQRQLINCISRLSPEQLASLIEFLNKL